VFVGAGMSVRPFERVYVCCVCVCLCLWERQGVKGVVALCVCVCWNGRACKTS